MFTNSLDKETDKQTDKSIIKADRTFGFNRYTKTEIDREQKKDITVKPNVLKQLEDNNKMFL